MIRALKVFGLVLMFAAAALIVVWVTGSTPSVIAALFGPARVWDETKLAPAPDYSRHENWAAFPGENDMAQMVPSGLTSSEDGKAVDIFFIHPTGYMSGASWNSPMNPSSRTEENTMWMMANQASVFNGCCNIYAPRYREASIFRYLDAPDDIANKAMDVAFSDVTRAFDYYLANINHGRPFIIASHSQGSQHAFRLVKERIDGTNLQGAMVAAYIVGTRVTNAEAAQLKSVKICDSATQTGCIVHWATFGEGGSPPPGMEGLVCVNPLTWRRDGVRAPASLHRGGVPISGRFSVRLWGGDDPQGVEFQPLGAPLPGQTWAECRNGLLIVADQASTVFGNFILPGKNYHGLDYPLFHMDIRRNVADRVTAWLHAGLQDGAAPRPQE